MKIIIVGGAGTIGKAIVEELTARHEVITAGRNSGDVHVDITNTQSIEKMYHHVGAFDALIAATGKVHFAPLAEMHSDDYHIGIDNKLMGQVNLVLHGRNHINDKGSFTLTSGILNHDPIAQGSSAAMVNGAIDGFVKAAAIELERGIRINAVSPTVVTEAMGAYAPYFRGYKPVSAKEAALAYSKSAEGSQNGQIYKVGY